MIEFKTTLDMDAQKALNRFTMRKVLIVFLIFSAIIVAIGIFGIVATEEDEDISSSITLIAVGLLFPPIMSIISKAAQKNAHKRAPYLVGQTKEIYRFYDDRIEHLQKKGETFFSQTRADYSYVYKAYSTSTHYFLYISVNQCHVIPKDRITQGTCEEFDALLASKLPVGKFKKKKR